MGKARESVESVESMRLDYLMAAKYFYLRAEGDDENLASALNRMKAAKLEQRFNVLGLPLPTAAEIYEYATDRWPAHKLHQRPGLVEVGGLLVVPEGRN